MIVVVFPLHTRYFAKHNFVKIATRQNKQRETERASVEKNVIVVDSLNMDNLSGLAAVKSWTD